MRFSDMLSLPLAALWQQKARTLLTTLGVLFGGFVLAASLSIGQGVQDTIRREWGRNEALRKITVRPHWGASENELVTTKVEVAGKMSDAKRERIRRALVDYQARMSAGKPRIVLSRETLDKLAAWEHVEAVVPVLRQYGYGVFDGQSDAAEVASIRFDDDALRGRLVAGRWFDEPSDEAVLVSEFLLYRLGVKDDDEVSRIIGKKLRLEFSTNYAESGIGMYLIKADGSQVTREETAAIEKIREQLPAALEKLDLSPSEIELLRGAIRPGSQPAQTKFAKELTIAGVLRLPSDEERLLPWDPLRAEADALVPVQAASEMYFRLPGANERGADLAVVIVDREEHLKEVYQRVKELGLNAHAVLEYVEQQRLMYLLIFGGMTCVAAVAMLVAALGIANTMLMSVLERTREIGIMKAVGASNGQLQFIFLLEGALIGLVGGGLGMLLAWAASYPGDAWVRSRVSRDLKIELKEAVFVFPPWVVATVLLFSIVVTTLAAVYPARRAAKIDPVAALRHE
jgi:putative ABC transport system permease protein